MQLKGFVARPYSIRRHKAGRGTAPQALASASSSHARATWWKDAQATVRPVGAAGVAFVCVWNNPRQNAATSRKLHFDILFRLYSATNWKRFSVSCFMPVLSGGNGGKIQGVKLPFPSVLDRQGCFSMDSTCSVSDGCVPTSVTPSMGFRFRSSGVGFIQYSNLTMRSKSKKGLRMQA